MVVARSTGDIGLRVKFSQEQARRPRGGEQMYSSTLPSTSALDGGGWSTPRSGRFIPWKDPVTKVQEAGWAPGPLWTGATNLAPTAV